MSKSYDSGAGTLIIPDAYGQYTIQSNPSGLSSTGVLMLVGEAEAGPSYAQETDLDTNAYGPDQVGEVLAKYGSGPLVDAFKAAASPANDVQLQGSFTRAILAKTNTSTQAYSTLAAWSGDYGVLRALSYGRGGNSISYQVTAATAEVQPTLPVATFTYIPSVGAFNYGIAVNGARVGSSISANTTPTSFVSTINALAGVSATGGADRGIVTVAGKLELSHASNVVTITRTISATWAVQPVIGDTLVIPVGSILDGGAGQENVGAYVVTGVPTTGSVTAVKLSDAGKATPAGVAGVITEPADVSAADIASVTDLVCYSPVALTVDALDPINGIGKTLEVAEKTGAADLLSRCIYNLGTTVKATWVSTASASVLLTGTESRATIALVRHSDNYSESFTVGGELALKLCYHGTGTAAVMTLNGTALTTTCTGDSGSNLSLVLADYATIGALATYINAHSAYTASVGTAQLGNLPVSALDKVSAVGIWSGNDVSTCRVKIDAYRFFNAVSGSALVLLDGQSGDGKIIAVRADAGLPKSGNSTYLANGAKGFTVDADVTGALTALEACTGNFLVPCFSRDASSDVTDSLTDGSSTYTITGIHAACKSHVLAMSTLKRKRHRQAFLSVADTFDNSKTAAANLASFRCSLTFQDFKAANSSGTVTQFLPWLGASIAAGMQAAGGYRNIEHKGVNCSGVLSRAGDFNPKVDSQMESALTAGLMPAKAAPGGGFIFVSDQTTYGFDNNFVLNSVQAVYAADTVTLTLCEKLGKAFVGQSNADISAPIALSFTEAVLADLLRLKLIAPSDGAERGYKDLKVKISGNVMQVSLSIRLATALDFIVINIEVSAVEQSA